MVQAHPFLLEYPFARPVILECHQPAPYRHVAEDEHNDDEWKRHSVQYFLLFESGPKAFLFFAAGWMLPSVFVTAFKPTPSLVYPDDKPSWGREVPEGLA